MKKKTFTFILIFALIVLFGSAILARGPRSGIRIRGWTNKLRAPTVNDDIQKQFEILDFWEYNDEVHVLTDKSKDNAVWAKLAIVSSSRVTSGVTLTTAHNNVFVDTDGGAITVGLPIGIVDTYYRIVNTGSSGNDVTLQSTDAELLLGATGSVTLFDDDALIIVYQSTEGWF